MISGSTLVYEVTCDLSKDEKNRYFAKLKSKIDENTKNIFENKLGKSYSIKNYLNRKFKCVYISATDEIIADQADKAVKDMFLQYYKQKSNTVKKSIRNFEGIYSKLHQTLQDNIISIQTSIENEFSPSKSGLENIKPIFTIEKNIDINDFLLRNLSFQVDDSYSHNIDNKGAGVQRATLILLNIFLLEEIYHNKNKIILLDEPEAFLYPLLIQKMKKNLELTVHGETKKFQIFLTTHSSEFLSEVNNSAYSFYNVKQNSKAQKFSRSTNDFDTVKYSVIQKYDPMIKNEVLRNYGLLHQIDDYENIIICEGPTDANYILKLFESSSFVPQVRFGSYYKEMKYMGKGVSSIAPILYYLSEISNVNRKVFILLDGDNAGRKSKEDLEKIKLKNLDLFIFILHKGKQIEDYVYSVEQYVERLVDIYPNIMEKVNRNDLITYLTPKKENSIIDKTVSLLDIYNIEDINIMKIKHELSINLENINLKATELLDEINEYFN